MRKTKSEELYKESSKYFPGGVNSPVRAFKSVDGTPLFITKGDKDKVWDADGNEYIDFCASWGPLILGHNNEAIKKAVVDTAQNGLTFGAPTIQENQLAKLILDNNRFIDKLRFVSSGTEAVMSAIRLARGFTGRDKFIKFEGCYHGHADHLLVKAGSGLITFGASSSAGVPEGFAKETIVLPLNDKEALIEAFEKLKDEISCIILEPIPANNGLLLQDRSYLEFMIKLAHDNGALVIFDEVISGFRVGFEGAAGLYNLAPDIVTYGKIIGGGMPVGAYGASAEIMSHIAPEGNVYQAGTLSGNPVAMAAGVAQLSALLVDGFYENQAKKTISFCATIQNHIDANNYQARVFSIGSIFWISFSTMEKLQNADEIDGSKMGVFKTLHAYLLANGVYFGPSGYEVGFVSAAHTTDSLEKAAKIICAGLDKALNH
jgi:glutamate-1-semialdehyde 2,1-aminomutase